MTPYRIFLIAAFLAVFVWAAINPLFPHDWLLENYLVFIFVPLILIVSRYLKLSDVSYTLITIFFILHVVGSHYTYAEVPFGDMLQDWFGASRNMYDRLVHFSFGFLLAYPIREVFVRLSGAKGFWGFYFPFDVTLAFSAVYEIIEWLTAATVDPAAGLAFLGSQGDVWDAQKDMLLAGIGAALAMAIIFIINLFLNSGFWQEFKASFRVPENDEPLGEVRLRRFLRKRGFSQLIVILILAVLAGAWYFTDQYLRPTKMCWPYCPEMTDADREEINESAREAETANWQTYRNEEYGFEFKYPPGAELKLDLFPQAPPLPGEKEFAIFFPELSTESEAPAGIRFTVLPLTSSEYQTADELYEKKARLTHVSKISIGDKKGVLWYLYHPESQWTRESCTLTMQVFQDDTLLDLSSVFGIVFAPDAMSKECVNSLNSLIPDIFKQTVSTFRFTK